MAAGDLITRSEYLTGVGTAPGDVDVVEQGQIDQAITDASQAIRDYCDRSFGVASVVEARTYEYDGSGFLDIDDATAVSAVSITYGAGLTPDSLTADQFRARPIRGPVFTYLVLPSIRGVDASGEMGFLQNLDRLYAEGRFATLQPVVNVSGTFGYPNVPSPVKRAAILTVKSFIADQTEDTSESIDTYSHSRSATDTFALPQRAKELLAPYQRQEY